MAVPPFADESIEEIADWIVREGGGRPAILLHESPQDRRRDSRTLEAILASWRGIEPRALYVEARAPGAEPIVQALASQPPHGAVLVDGIYELPDGEFRSFWESLNADRDRLPGDRDLVLWMTPGRMAEAHRVAADLLSICRLFRPTGSAFRVPAASLPDSRKVLLGGLETLRRRYGWTDEEFLDRWARNNAAPMDPGDAQRWIALIRILQGQEEPRGRDHP